MKQELLKKCPEWAYKDMRLERDLILSDDADGLMSCNLLTEVTNGLWKINNFCEFTTMYGIKKATSKSTIAVDLAFTKNIKGFDNHVTKINPNDDINRLAINPNNFKPAISANRDYYRKYPFSTLMLIMSYYDIPMPTTDEGKGIILSIDSAYKGFYKENKFFKDIYINWLEDMGFTSLIDFLSKRDEPYFESIKDEYSLGKKILMSDEGYLHTGIDLKRVQPYLDWKLELPKQQFKVMGEFIQGSSNTNQFNIPKEQLLIRAVTKKDLTKYSYIDK